MTQPLREGASTLISALLGRLAWAYGVGNAKIPVASELLKSSVIAKV
jgi:hypothetical protein